MAAHVFETPNEKAISGALALVMHALFFSMLVFSVNWKKPEPAAMVAELWSNLPSPKSEVPPPPPPVPPKVEPEPPKPEPKVEVKPAPKVEPKPQPKAEIDLNEKKEKERKAKEELAEKKKREEQDKQAKQAKEAAETKRLAQEQADALKKLAAQQAAQQAQQASDRAKELDKYRAAISAKIKKFIVEPPNIQGNPVAELDIIMLPSGEVLDVRTKKVSGQTAWDNACERAIRRAQPLPLPSDPTLMKELRELAHLCRYKE